MSTPAYGQVPKFPAFQTAVLKWEKDNQFTKILRSDDFKNSSGFLWWNKYFIARGSDGASYEIKRLGLGERIWRALGFGYKETVINAKLANELLNTVDELADKVNKVLEQNLNPEALFAQARRERAERFGKGAPPPRKVDGGKGKAAVAGKEKEAVADDAEELRLQLQAEVGLREEAEAELTRLQKQLDAFQDRGGKGRAEDDEKYASGRLAQSIANAKSAAVGSPKDDQGVAQLRQQLQQLQSENNQLRSQLQTPSRSKEGEDPRISQFQERVTQLQGEVAAWTKAAQGEGDKSRNAAAENQKLRDELRQLRSKSTSQQGKEGAQLSQESQRSTKRIAELERELSALKESAAKAKEGGQEVAQLQQANAALRAQLATAEKQRDEHQGFAWERGGELADLQKANADLRSEAEKAKQRLGTERDTIQRQFAGQFGRLNEAFLKKGAAVKALEEQVATLTQQLGSVQSEREKQMSDLTEQLKKKNAGLTEMERVHREVIDTERNAAIAARGKAGHLEAGMKQLQAALEKQQGEAKAAREEAAKLRQMLQEQQKKEPVAKAAPQPVAVAPEFDEKAFNELARRVQPAIGWRAGMKEGGGLDTALQRAADKIAAAPKLAKAYRDLAGALEIASKYVPTEMDIKFGGKRKHEEDFARDQQVIAKEISAQGKLFEQAPLPKDAASARGLAQQVEASYPELNRQYLLALASKKLQEIELLKKEKELALKGLQAAQGKLKGAGDLLVRESAQEEILRATLALEAIDRGIRAAQIRFLDLTKGNVK